MQGKSEVLFSFKNFDAWGWEADFQRALETCKPGAQAAAIDRMRLEIVIRYIEFIREIVSEEFRLALLIDVEGLTKAGIVGCVDFKDGRREALEKVEAAVGDWGPIPKVCRTGAILDRLLFCTEVVRAQIG